jgi:Ni,Fe-hydrogenase III component G
MENKIAKQLIERFPYLEERITIRRENCILTAGLEKDEFQEIFNFAFNELGFLRPHVVVGVDDIVDLGVIYVFSNKDNVLLGIKVRIPKSDPVLTSISGAFPSLIWYERELVDLFGIQVHGLPDGPSYPLPDGWPKGSYPLRKEWNPAYFDKETMTYNPPEEKEEGQ